MIEWPDDLSDVVIPDQRPPRDPPAPPARPPPFPPFQSNAVPPQEPGPPADQVPHGQPSTAPATAGTPQVGLPDDLVIDSDVSDVEGARAGSPYDDLPPAPPPASRRIRREEPMGPAALQPRHRDTQESEDALQTPITPAKEPYVPLDIDIPTSPRPPAEKNKEPPEAAAGTPPKRTRSSSPFPFPATGRTESPPRSKGYEPERGAGAADTRVKPYEPGTSSSSPQRPPILPIRGGLDLPPDMPPATPGVSSSDPMPVPTSTAPAPALPAPAPADPVPVPAPEQQQEQEPNATAPAEEPSTSTDRTLEYSDESLPTHYQDMVDHLDIPKIVNLCERLPDGRYKQGLEEIYDEMLSMLSNDFDFLSPALCTESVSYTHLTLPTKRIV